MTQGRRFSEALDYHERGRPGKLEIRPTKPTATQQDLSLAYTPGVAEPCLAIAADPDDAFRYTNKGNLVAVVTNGSAVLGLGDIGPLAGKPVMEGKAVLFKRFADIDVFDLEVASHDPEDIIKFCRLLEPTVGGINLEDIKAPDCFVVEETLRQSLQIPVFHDDQHGTAIIGAAAFLNALEISDRRIEETRVVFSGAGAAGIACARFFRHLGVQPENMLLCDSRGVIHDGRDDLTPIKAEFSRATDRRTLADALMDADAFVGVSVGGTVSGEMLETMAPTPIIFALANPDPEIGYDEARRIRPDALVATGRSDFPNQVNNVLGFPFIFRGALDVRATAVTEGMKIAAANALALLAKQPVPDVVLKAYDLDYLSFGSDYLIPKPFDPRVLWWVAPAVAEAATAEGVARRPLQDAEEYGEQLRRRFQASYGLIHNVTVKARERAMTVAYSAGDDVRIIRAARRVVDEGLGSPILVGAADSVERAAVGYHIPLDGVRVLDPSAETDLRARYAATMAELRAHKGMTVERADKDLLDPNLFAVMMVRQGDADAVLGGLTTPYPDTVRPALQLIKLEQGRSIAAAIYVVVVSGRPYFFADCAVNIEPSAEQLAEIAVSTAAVARDQFDINPRVGFISYSNFGSAAGEEPDRVRRAVELCADLDPRLAVEGEMHADTAVVSELLERRKPGSRLGGRSANVLVFPNLTAANASYKLLNRLGDAEVIGPILTGLARSVHILQLDADVGDVVNLTAIAMIDAHRKQRVEAPAG